MLIPDGDPEIGEKEPVTESLSTGMHTSDPRTSDMRDLTRMLDAEQRRAVTTSAPLLAVIAGAGSGKTSVLTRRVAWRCLNGTTDPMHTAVFTFTRQAAAELRRRLRSLGLQDSVTAGTFHAISLSLLQQHWERIDRRPPSVVQDRRRLIGEVIGPRRTTSIEALAREIDWARARNITARSYAHHAEAAGRSSHASASDVERVMVDLEELKAKRGIIDLDDLLSLIVDTAAKDPEFINILRWRLRHLYVDEAQDMNPLQRAVLGVLRGDRDDLTLVGDPFQAIYGFNGSDPMILLELEKHFPGIEIIRLDTNYRCSPQIVRAGLSALTHLEVPLPSLRSARPDRAEVAVYAFDDEEAEARGVARLLEGSRRPHDSWNQFAVLARTNAQLGPIRAALEAASIPVRISTTHGDDPLQRCIKEVGELSSRARIAAWSRDAYASSLADVETEASIPADPDRQTRDAAVRVARAIEEFLSDGGSDGRSFLAWVRAQRPFDDASHAVGVDLVTLHAAKGREWDTVIVIGCEDGLLPHSSAKLSDARAEEIRLTYVAMTRAADRLLMTYSKSRKGRARVRSPFLSQVQTHETISPPPPEFLTRLEERRSQRPHADPILDALREWRIHAAHVSGVDPRMICPEDVLVELARRQPSTIDELADISGLGAPLIDRAGRAIIQAIEAGLTPKNVAD